MVLRPLFEIQPTWHLLTGCMVAIFSSKRYPYFSTLQVFTYILLLWSKTLIWSSALNSQFSFRLKSCPFRVRILIRIILLVVKIQIMVFSLIPTFDINCWFDYIQSCFKRMAWGLIYNHCVEGVLSRFYKSDFFFLHTPFLAFVCTFTFSLNPTHCFIREALSPFHFAFSENVNCILIWSNLICSSLSFISSCFNPISQTGSVPPSSVSRL